MLDLLTKLDDFEKQVKELRKTPDSLNMLISLEIMRILIKLEERIKRLEDEQ